MKFCKIKKGIHILAIKAREKTFGGVDYLYKNKKSDILVITFSGFATHDKVRTYNYVSTCSKHPVDTLHIKDSWGCRGSYYLMHEGNPYPYYSVLNLIYHILGKRDYKKIICAGSSKGGSAALIFGLKIGATDIFAAACQYHIGTYVVKFDDVYRKMCFDHHKFTNIANGWEELNEVIPSAIHNGKPNQTIIHLFYSMNEHTYENEIIDLVEELKQYKYVVEETVCQFSTHSEVGTHFAPFLDRSLKHIAASLKDSDNS